MAPWALFEIIAFGQWLLGTTISARNLRSAPSSGTREATNPPPGCIRLLGAGSRVFGHMRIFSTTIWFFLQVRVWPVEIGQSCLIVLTSSSRYRLFFDATLRLPGASLRVDRQCKYFCKSEGPLAIASKAGVMFKPKAK